MLFKHIKTFDLFAYLTILEPYFLIGWLVIILRIRKNGSSMYKAPLTARSKQGKMYATLSLHRGPTCLYYWEQNHYVNVCTLTCCT